MKDLTNTIYAKTLERVIIVKLKNEYERDIMSVMIGHILSI